MFAVRYIRQCQLPTVATDLFPTQEEQTEPTFGVEFLVDSAAQTSNVTVTEGVQTDSVEEEAMDDKPEIQGDPDPNMLLDSTLGLDEDCATSGQFTVDSATQTISGTVTSGSQAETVEDEAIDDKPEPQGELKSLLDLTFRLRKNQTGRLKKELINLARLINQVQKKISQDVQLEKQHRQSEMKKVQRAHRKALTVMRDELRQLAGHEQLVISEGTQVKEEQRQLSEKVTEIHELLKGRRQTL